MKFTLVDAHVHIHDIYNLNELFDSARSNFLKHASELNSESIQAVLCLTESHNINYFKELSQKARINKKIGNWKVEFTENENALCLKDENRFILFLIAGRQIVTKENLEVLALGLLEDPEDSKPIEEVIQYVKIKKAIPVIPWGAGKWLGKRKEIVKKLVLQKFPIPIYLGDNGNRPYFWSKPNIFQLAKKNNVLNIPGSDPLPFYKEVHKAGSYGFIFDGLLDIEKPFDSVYEKLTYSKEQFVTYGRTESFFSFLKNQILMQIVKRNRK